MERCHLVVTGHVQGVCFRWYAQRTAGRLGLCGWVRNLPDGGVEIVAEGSRSDLGQLVDWARHGPAEAEVDTVEADFAPATGEFTGFEIRG